LSYVDIQGRQYGYLVAEKYLGKGIWECLCLNCGNRKPIKGEHLRLGYIESCGCLHTEQSTRGKKTNGYIIRTNKGHAIQVDAEDIDRLSRHSWYIGADGYPQAKIKGHMVRMHEFLLRRYRGDGLVIDHINNDRTDNRKENLRIVSKSQNRQNSKKPEDREKAG